MNIYQILLYAAISIVSIVWEWVAKIFYVIWSTEISPSTTTHMICSLDNPKAKGTIEYWLFHFRPSIAMLHIFFLKASRSVEASLTWISKTITDLALDLFSPFSSSPYLAIPFDLASAPPFFYDIFYCMKDHIWILI